jgi:hypothetical protein
MQNDFDVFRNKDNSVDELELPIQDSIEANMKEIVTLGNYDAVFLYDQDGLLIASCSGKDDLEERRVIEISMLVKKVKAFAQNLAKMSDLKEIVLEDSSNRKVVFRFISFLTVPTILVAVVPSHKTYRGLTNRLQRAIQKLTLLEI